MKNYKNLVPIVLIVLFFLGIYMKFDTNTSKINEYKNYLAQARSYREAGIHVDAEENYLAAIDVNPNVELYVEIGEFYKEINERRAINWGESIVDIYPEDTLGYEFLLGVYKDVEKYEDFFEVYTTMTKRGVYSEIVDGYTKELENEYFFARGRYDDVSYYSGGLCAVEKDGYWAYVNQSGTQKTKSDYISAGFFSGDVAPVVDKLEESYYIDSDGEKKYIVNKEDIEILGGYNTLCVIYDGESWGGYNLDGELQFGGYANISSLSNGVIAVEKDGQWTLLDTSGKQLISESFDNIKQDEKGIVYRNSRLFVQTEGVYYMIDAEGNRINGIAYEDVKLFLGSGYAAVKIDGKWGFVNENGEIMIEPQYEDARSFSNGYAAVMSDGYWGFIDTEGELFIDYQFTDVRDFTSSGSAFIKQSDEWKLLRLYKYNY